MTWTLFGKLLRDIRVPLLLVMLLFASFEAVWTKASHRTVTQLAPFFSALIAGRGGGLQEIEDQVFKGPGKIVHTMLGGDQMRFEHAMDMLAVGYIHPLLQVLLCIWAAGRAAGAVAGEIERGTMELLLAQPLARSKIILAHLLVDVVTIPLLCLALWGGMLAMLAGLGPWEFDPDAKPLTLPKPSTLAVEVGPFKFRTESPLSITTPEADAEELAKTLVIRPTAFGAGLWNIAALMFAVSGLTMWLSARGRSRWQATAWAVGVLTVLFLVNLLGQLLESCAFLRPLSLFYYYQPHLIALKDAWTVDLGAVWGTASPIRGVNVLVVLFTVGVVGYGLAWRTLVRRDIPAPL